MAKKYVGIKALKVVCEYMKAVFVRKVNGKGLSSNDFTNEYKRKLDDIESNATSNPVAPRIFIVRCPTGASTANKKVTLSNEQTAILKDTNGCIPGDLFVVNFAVTNTAIRPKIHLKLGDDNILYPIHFAGKSTDDSDLPEDGRAIAGGTANMYCSYVFVEDSNRNKLFVWTGISDKQAQQAFNEGTVAELNNNPVNVAKLWSSQVLSNWLGSKKYNSVYNTTPILKTVDSVDRFCLKIEDVDSFSLRFGQEILVSIGENSELRSNFDSIFKSYFVLCNNDGEVLTEYDSNKFVFRYDGMVTDVGNGTDPFTEEDKVVMFPADKYSRFIYLGDDVWMWIGHEYSDSGSVDISGKANKLVMTGSGAATENNFMAIDANGDIKDSGHKHSDYATTDTKDTTSVRNDAVNKLYLVGSKAQSQTVDGQTVYYYKTATNKYVFIDTEGHLNCKDPNTERSVKVSIEGHTHPYVSYNSQTLTTAQKQQARTNIGAGTSNLELGTGNNNAARGDHNHDERYLMSLPSHNHDGRYYTESEIDNMFANIGSIAISDRTITSKKLSKNVAPKITDEVTTVTFEWDYTNDVLVATEGYYSNWSSYTEVYFGDTQSGDVYIGKCLEFNGSTGTFDEISLADATNPCYIFGIARPATNAEMNNYGAEFMGTYVLLSIDVRNSVFDQIKKLYEYEDPNTREMLIDEEHGMFLVNFGWLSGSEQVTIKSTNVNFRFVSNRMATLGKVDLYQLGGTPATVGQLAYVDGLGIMEEIDKIQDIIDRQSI